MNLEVFFQLKEIYSIEKLVDEQTKIINEENLRLLRLKEQRDKRITHNDSLGEKLSLLQKRLNEVEEKLKQRLNPEVLDQVEAQGLTLLEEIEKVELEKTDTQTFLQGLAQSFKEIQSEVSQTQDQAQQQIDSYKQRINLLTDGLPVEAQSLLSKVQRRSLAHGPFSFIQAGRCHFCHMSVSKQDESDIDTKLALKTCKSCGRIMLPYKVIYG